MFGGNVILKLLQCSGFYPKMKAGKSPCFTKVIEALLQTNRQLLSEIARSANITEKLQLAPEDSCLKHVVRDQLSTADSFAEMTDYFT